MVNLNLRWCCGVRTTTYFCGCTYVECTTLQTIIFLSFLWRAGDEFGLKEIKKDLHLIEGMVYCPGE